MPGQHDIPKMPRPAVHDPSFNAGDERAVEKRKSRADANRERELNDMRVVLSTPEGERAIYRLLGMAGLYRSSFNTNGLAMGFTEGKRQVGLLILAEVEAADPQAFIRMQLNNLTNKEASNG